MTPDVDSREVGDLIGRTIGGRYQVERVLGAGGMGAVYRATTADGRAVALKVLHAEMFGTEAIPRFLREGMLVQKIDSPHIVRVEDVGLDEQNDALFITMELLQGSDVEELLERTGALHALTAARVAAQAADGLAAAHRTGVIHRDVKPANLFLATGENEVTVRVCDFGAAKQVEGGEALTITGTRIGSPLYMSPEQIKSSKHIDERTDVWGLGVTLYEMLAGRAPFADIESFADLFLAIATTDAPPLKSRAPWVPDGLCAIVHQAIERDPARRWPSMAAFGDALHAYCAGSLLITQSMLVVPPQEETRDWHDDTLADAESGQDTLIGQSLDGRFHVIGVLGRGGMGSVYEVEGSKGEHLAAKIIASGNKDKQAVRRLVREARTASDVDSPNVVRTLEIGSDSTLDTSFIIMELLRGFDLGTLLERERALEPTSVVRIFLQAARGLAAAHSRNIIHRDIKPANLFLQTDPSSSRVTTKVCDFGIAKLADVDTQTQELTRTGGMIGSPLYMSPEQARNAKHVDQRTDIWSLSVAMWEALAGRHLWEGPTALGEIILTICGDPIPRLEEFAPWVDPALAAVVHRGLSRDPDDRFRSVDEMITALEPFAGDSRDITIADLHGVGEQAMFAGRSDLAISGDAPTIAATAQPSTLDVLERSTTASGKRRGRTGIAVIAAALVVAVVAVVGFTVGRDDTKATAASASAVAPAPEPEPEPLRLAVSPADATVTIDGAAADVDSGHVELSGRPGDSFKVVVSSAGASKSVRVFITSERKLRPDHVEVTPPPPPSASAPPPVAEKTPGKRKPPRSRRAHPAKRKPTVTKPPASNPAKPATPQIKPKDTW